MWGGQLWGTLFFIFMSFAALSTVIGVFENIVAFCMDQWGVSRRSAVAINAVLIIVLSVPCILGFNVWQGVQFPGIGDIQSLEDFIVSNNVLPLGGLVYVLFCTSRYGWAGRISSPKQTPAPARASRSGRMHGLPMASPCSWW